MYYLLVYDTGSFYVAQGDLELTDILLPQPPEFWNYRCASSLPTFKMLGKIVQQRILCLEKLSFKNET
jgi:hypothetical protein